MGATDHRWDLIPHSGHRAGISSVSFRRRSRVKPGMRFFLFFSLYRQRGRTKRELVARSGSDKITIHRSLCNSVTTRHSSSKLDSALAAPSFHSFAAGLASLKQVLAMPSAPCSIIGFSTFPSRYRNVLRSKGRHDYVAYATFGFCPHCGNTYPIKRPEEEKQSVGDRFQSMKQGALNNFNSVKGMFDKKDK